MNRPSVAAPLLLKFCWPRGGNGTSRKQAQGAAVPVCPVRRCPLELQSSENCVTSSGVNSKWSSMKQWLLENALSWAQKGWITSGWLSKSLFLSLFPCFLDAEHTVPPLARKSFLHISQMFTGWDVNWSKTRMPGQSSDTFADWNKLRESLVWSSFDLFYLSLLTFSYVSTFISSYLWLFCWCWRWDKDKTTKIT